MNAEIYLELLREAHLAAIQRGATLTGGTRLGLGERIDDDMQFNTETGSQDTPGTYPVPSESRELNVFADAALAEMKVGLTRQGLVDVLVNQFNIPRSNLVYAWDIPTYAVMRDGQRQSELEPEFFTGNPLDPASVADYMQSSAYRPNNQWAGRQGKDVSGATVAAFNTETGEGGPAPKYPDAEGPVYEHTNPFIANSATGWGIEAALGAVLGPTGLAAGKRLLGPLFRAMPQLPPAVLARFRNIARGDWDWKGPAPGDPDWNGGIGVQTVEAEQFPGQFGPTDDVPVHNQRGAFDQDSEFDQVVASLWEEMDRIRGELPQGPIDPTRGNFRPRGFEDGTKSADRLQEPRPEMWGDGAGGGGEPPRRNNVFDDYPESYDGWDEERMLNRQAEIVDGADAGRWELTDESDDGWLLYVEHFNLENELRLRRGQQFLPANPTDRVGSMHDAASRGEYFEWLAEVQLPFVRGGAFDQTQIVPLDDLDRHLDSAWEQMLGETDPSSLSFTDALKSLGSGAAIAGATAVTAQTLFPEQVEKVVSGLATFNDGWWSWIKEFPEHLDWVVRAAGATLDGMEQGTRSMGSPVLDGLSDGFREEAGGWMGSLGGGAVPVMGRQDASMLKGLSKDLSEQGHNGQAMFPNDIRREIENGDAMIVGYRSDADYQRAVEESGQYGIEVDRHFWRKPNRKNIRPAEGQPWTSDNLKKLAATNYFYPDAGARRGQR